MAEIRHLENRHDVIFSAEGGPIWIKFRRLVQNDMLTAVIWLKSKPDVEFQYGGHLGEFSGMSSQSHLPHCRVMWLGEFSVMIPELRVTLHGAATGQIQWHVIPEPHITLQGVATWWIHCHDSRATCHIAGCSHLAKSVLWSCYITLYKNFICYVENRFLRYFMFLVFLMQFGLWWASAFVLSPIHLLILVGGSFAPWQSSSSHMHVMNHNLSATKQHLHPQSVTEISRHSVLSGDRIRQCETSSGSRHKDSDTDQCL